MVEVYALPLPHEDGFQKNMELCGYVSSEKNTRIQRMASKKDALRILWADLLIRVLIMDKYKLKNEEISFITNPYGKPVFEGDPSFAFNLSHSGNWIVAAVAEQGQWIGVDIEEIRPIELDIAERFFAPAEYRHLITESKSRQLGYFYDLWTLKESYLKATGAGLTLPLDSFAIHKDRESGTISISQTHSAHAFFFRQYDVDPSYKLSVCSTEEGFAAAVKRVDCSEVYERISGIPVKSTNL
ncbi:4'-phosphopantetheinyl transferase family protein [Paenibacillus rhizophilus]|uniref:4'-phosphopantetheinyl transferase superfamily protein n=1 Tax=Paenibacillus rhizophilus TaxID=1850366 RepID=A0A3N9PAX9_9BACL|nr:4'-phosphopantetheinyl transferase superfamily protein [Paenibacillus rhizophilus]RQW12755.1 4'-phosphopantetheinyl transferase superfamily protein [Paenibacillus rhizophilus]